MIKNYNIVNLSTEISIIDIGEEENAVINAPPPTQRFHYILHYVLKGKGIYKTSSQDTYKLSAGDAFVIHKNDTVYYESNHNDPLHYFWIGFDGKDSEKILQYLGFSKVRMAIPLKNYKLIKSAFSKLICSYLNKDIYKMFANFFECLSVIRQANPTSQTDTTITDSLLSSSILYMENNLDKNLMIEDVARHLNVSRNSFSKKFKATFNTSPHKYFLSLKLSKAATLLESSEKNINEISDSLGFTDNYVFSKIFKKHFGVSPTTYRKMRQTKKDKLNKRKFSE